MGNCENCCEIQPSLGHSSLPVFNSGIRSCPVALPNRPSFGQGPT